MMRKICLSVMALVFSLQAVVSAEVVNVSYSEDNSDYVVISGNENVSAESKVTISIFKKGKTYADLVGNFEDESDIIAFAGVTYTDENSVWEIEWKPANSGEYDFYVASDGVLLGSSSATLVSGMNDIYNKIRNGTKSDIVNVFAVPEVIKTFVTDDNLRTQIKSTEDIALSIYNIREYIVNEDVISYIPLAARMAAFDSELSEESLDALMAEMSKFNILVSNYQVYENYATADIKGAMSKMLDGVCALSIQGFDSKFTDAMILAGVWKCTNWTDAHNFLSLMNNEQYANNKDKVAKAVAGKQYSTITDLQNAIVSAVNTNNNDRPSSGGGGGGGGGSSNKKETVPSVIVDVTAVPEADKDDEQTEDSSKAESNIFNDVDSGHWAYDYINLLRWKNIVSGDDKGYFYPDNNITRAEVVKLLCEIYGINPVGSRSDFNDVEPDKWYAGYVYAAYDKGLVSGTSQEEFGPTRSITRQDMAVMIYRFATANSVAFDKTENISFTDNGMIAEYAKEAMDALVSAGVITGMGDGTVMPMNTATRAQAAVMLCRVMEAGKQVIE